MKSRSLVSMAMMFGAILAAGTVVAVSSWSAVPRDVLEGADFDRGIGYELAVSADGMVLAAQIGDYSGPYDVMAFGWDDDLGSMEQRGATIVDAAPAAFSEDGSTMAVVRTDRSVETFEWDAEVSEWTMIGDPLVTGMALIGPVSLSYDASVLVVGSYSTETAGIVRTYDWDAETTAWVSRTDDLVGEGTTDRFGSDLAITPDASAMVVSAVYHPSSTAAKGRVYVYDRNAGTGNWGLRDTFDGDFNYDNLGYAVAISADGNVVGASAPCALECDGLVRTWVWDRCSGSVTALTDIEGVGFEELGDAIDFSDDGSILAIGTGYSDVDSNDNDEGSLKVYGLTGGGWEPLIDTIFGNAGDGLGYPVTELSGDGLLLTSHSRFRAPNGAIVQYDLIPETAPLKSPMKRCEPVPNGLRKGQIIRSDGTSTDVEASVVGSDLVVGDGTYEITIEGTDGVLTPGETLTVKGRKLRNPDVWIQSDPVLLGSINTGSSTEFSLEITIPANLAPGLHTLQVEDGSVGIAVGVEVPGIGTTTVPASTTVPAPTTVALELPPTGNDSRVMLVLALGVIALGATFTRLRSRSARM